MSKTEVYLDTVLVKDRVQSRQTTHTMFSVQNRFQRTSLVRLYRFRKHDHCQQTGLSTIKNRPWTIWAKVPFLNSGKEIQSLKSLITRKQLSPQKEGARTTFGFKNWTMFNLLIQKNCQEEKFLSNKFQVDFSWQTEEVAVESFSSDAL